jgi:hypothetical protein
MNRSRARSLAARRVVALLALSGMMLAACSSGDDDASPDPEATAAPLALSADATTFVAAVPDTDAYLAVTTDGTQVRTYLCDGVSTSVWLAGSLDDDGAFRGEGDHVVVEVTVDDADLAATVTTTDGRSHEVATTAVGPDGSAGLYRGESAVDDSSVVGGWIVLPDGSVRGYVEQDNIAVSFQPTGAQLVQQLASRGSVTLGTTGTLRITDGTSNTVRG